MTKIEIGNKSAIIGTREEMAKYADIIKNQSSTELQPYASVNFLDGNPVGGTTITELYRKTIIGKMAAAGAKISEI